MKRSLFVSSAAGAAATALLQSSRARATAAAVPIINFGSYTAANGQAWWQISVRNSVTGATVLSPAAVLTNRPNSLLVQNLNALTSLGKQWDTTPAIETQLPTIGTPYKFFYMGPVTMQAPPTYPIRQGQPVTYVDGVMGWLLCNDGRCNYATIAYFPTINAVFYQWSAADGTWPYRWIVGSPPRPTGRLYPSVGESVIGRLQPERSYTNLTNRHRILPNANLGNHECQAALLLLGFHALMIAGSAMLLAAALPEVGFFGIAFVAEGAILARVFAAISFGDGVAGVLSNFVDVASACQDRVPMKPIDDKPNPNFTTYPAGPPQLWGYVPSGGDTPPDSPPEAGGRQAGQCAPGDWNCIHVK